MVTAVIIEAYKKFIDASESDTINKLRRSTKVEPLG